MPDISESNPRSQEHTPLAGGISDAVPDNAVLDETVSGGEIEQVFEPLQSPTPTGIPHESGVANEYAAGRHYAHEAPSQSRMTKVRHAGKKGAVVVTLATGAVLAAKGYTPHPPVNATSAVTMIEANDAIRNGGETAIGLAGLGLAAGYIYRRRSPHFDATLRSTKGNKLAQGANLGLMSLLIGTSAAGSALGDAAAEGAGKPVAEIANGLSPNHPESTIFVTQHKHALPFDHSELQTPQASVLDLAVAAHGGKTVPYSLLLGDARHMTPGSDPSSSAIVLVPNAAIQQKYGVTLNNQVDAAGKPICETGEVIINKQFGAEPRDRVLVEDKKFEVAKTIEAYPGLDRSLVVGSLEEAANCITSKDIISGEAISGLSEAQVKSLLHELHLPYSAQNYTEYQKQYADFWDKSVKPPEMQLVLYLWLASLAGLSIVKIGEINRRRPLIASQFRDGVSRNSLALAEFPRAMTESTRALGYGTLSTLGLVTLNASSQFGIAERFDVQAVGAGFITGMAANLIGAGLGAAYVRKMSMASAERAK